MKKQITIAILVLISCNVYSQWEQIFPIPTDKNLYDVCYATDYIATAVGEDGTILYSTNSGFSWTQKESLTSLTLRSVCFSDSLSGWIVGGSTQLDEAIVLHTSDGGVNWNKLNVQTENNLNAVHFIDEKHV